jgi:hypothetical protein
MKCRLCNKEFNNLNGLSKHLYHSHDISKQDYYDQFIKMDKEDQCIICKQKTKFHSFHKGYNKTCSKKCSNILREETNLKIYGVRHIQQNKDIRKKTEKTNINLYGETSVLKTSKKEEGLYKKYRVDNASKLDFVKSKIKQTTLKNHGVENISQSKKIKKRKKETTLKNYGVEYGFLQKDKTKQTMLKNHGVAYPMQSPKIKNKSKQTTLKNYGVENISQLDEIKKVKKKTTLKNYGVEYPAQDPSIFEKILKTSLKLKKFKNTNLTYQGSYELDFLEKFYNRIDIENGPSISYKFNGKNKIYHSDFYIPSRSLIVEIKNAYLFKRDEEMIKTKKDFCIKNNYNCILILEKDYNKFENELQSRNN